jgi:hypothetical protein
VLGHRAINMKLHFPFNPCQISQMKGKFNANHAKRKTRMSNLEIRNKYETKVKVGTLEKRRVSVIFCFS